MPFLHPLHGQVRQLLRRYLDGARPVSRILDVGGRKSPYTIGLPGKVYLSELPRVSQLQHNLNLGITADKATRLTERRSNVANVVFDDMTHSGFRDGSFECVVAVEVIEHVERDKEFLDEVSRILCCEGLFLLTTPNGDSRPNTNPDHKRHYRRAELLDLLRGRFAEVEVHYAIKGGVFHNWGLPGWTLRRPFRTARAMLGNLVSRLESGRPNIKHQASGTHHLIAVLRKA